jgi:uracil-DNA glycosylase family 4
MPIILETLPELERWQTCQRCSYAAHRGHVCAGAGSRTADIFFVTDHPREEENDTGVIWTSTGGTDFRLLLEQQDLDVQRCFSDFVLSCPPYEALEDGVLELVVKQANVKACLPHLHEAIYRVDPLLIVALGRTAFAALTKNKDVNIRAARQDVHLCTIPGVKGPVPYPITVTFNPRVLRTSRGEPAFDESGARSDRGAYKRDPDSVWNLLKDDIAFARDLVTAFRKTV